MANAMARSQLVPPAFKGKPDDCIIAIQMGLEVGLAPLAAIQNIAVINGRPSIWGDAALAVARASGVFDERRWSEELIGQEGSDGWTAVCRCARINGATVERRFSVADAKRAGLWSKQGPWGQYPQRMLQMRARSWALRDCFTDALRGLQVAEEAADMIPYVETQEVSPGVAGVKERLGLAASPPPPEPPAETAPTSKPKKSHQKSGGADTLPADVPLDPKTYDRIKRQYDLLNEDSQKQFKTHFGLSLITDAKKVNEFTGGAMVDWIEAITGGEPE